MTILKKQIKNITITIVTVITLIVVIYYGYFYQGKHIKDLNKLRIEDFYDLRINTSVNELEEQYGKPTVIVKEYEKVYFIFERVVYERSGELIDDKRCNAIFKGNSNLRSFYDINFDLTNVEQYNYEYYNTLDMASTFIIYVKNNKVIGVDCG